MLTHLLNCLCIYAFSGRIFSSILFLLELQRSLETGESARASLMDEKSKLVTFRAILADAYFCFIYFLYASYMPNYNFTCNALLSKNG